MFLLKSFTVSSAVSSCKCTWCTIWTELPYLFSNSYSPTLIDATAFCVQQLLLLQLVLRIQVQQQEYTTNVDSCSSSPRAPSPNTSTKPMGSWSAVVSITISLSSADSLTLAPPWVYPNMAIWLSPTATTTTPTTTRPPSNPIPIRHQKTSYTYTTQ